MRRRERVSLRDFCDEDFDAFHAIASDIDVVKMTTSWPYPADPDFTKMRMTTPESRAGLSSAITVDDRFAGVISLIRGGVGYMLDRRYWGKGIATQALRLKLDHSFRSSDLEQVEAGVFIDNPASAKVLQKTGFRQTGQQRHFSAARDMEVATNVYQLTRQDWNILQGFHLKTERLTISPFEMPDAGQLSALMDTSYVTDMMATIPAPFHKVAAKDWITARTYKGTPGFAAKICLQDGTMVGFIYLHDHPTYVAYAIGQQFAGNGYATEAASAFLADCADRFALTDITAGAFADNPASQHVLLKLGFDRVGERVHKTSTRLEAHALYLYRLHRNIRKHHEIS